MKQPIILAWSGGKDSSMALYSLLQSETYEVKYLLTTLNAEFKRVSMHGTSEELLDAQSESIGIPLLKVWIHEASYDEYERQMEAVLLQAKSEGIEIVAFGDIFLEDLRTYREDKMKKIGMSAIFPLWKSNTTELVNEFLSHHFKTIICCTNDAFLGKEFVGRELNNEFLDSLPNNVDPCGENGEYHSFCFEGPIFRNPIPVKISEIIYRPLQLKEEADDCNVSDAIQTKGFWYSDLKLMQRVVS